MAQALGKTEIIMTDPDFEVTSNEIDECFETEVAQHAMTRRPVVFVKGPSAFSKRR